jgi:hypothetical protein
MRSHPGRRTFLKTSLAAGAVAAWRTSVGARAPRMRFAVIGINHSHIHGQIAADTRGGGGRPPC